MISIVIPTLNSAKYLDQTLRSIDKQNFDNYEVILVDSNSDDDTLRIAYFYHNIMHGKLKIYLMPKEGQVTAINYGLSLAKGDILTFLNSDDLYEQGCLAQVNHHFATYKDKEWAFGKGGVVDNQGRPTRSLVTLFKSIWWQKNSKRVLTWFDYICQPTVFWRAEVGLRFNPKYPYAFDYDAWLRLWEYSGEPIFINRYLANWRAHKDAISVKGTNAQIDESLRINLKYAQSWCDVFIQNGVALAEKVVYGVIK
jgi:glycosyltransferase involved in cell wall biosynthesis